MTTGRCFPATALSIPALAITALLAGCSGDDPALSVDAAVAPDLAADQAAPQDQGEEIIPCSVTHDCPQTWYCHYDRCIQDPQIAVYHCGKQEDGKDTCPPGRWCITADGERSVCAESESYACETACDCGPAHCCVELPDLGKRCVKDTGDPWQPGGTAIAGGACVPGVHATYCATEPTCHPGRKAYADDPERAGRFRAHDPESGWAGVDCTGQSCFGTACNCEPGQVCIDTVAADPRPGLTCLAASGGTCVSNAVAETVFGFPQGELLPCCDETCLPGERCDLGWRADDPQYTYRRRVGTCGSCGNGTCEPGELNQTCAEDCTCGDGTCSWPGDCAEDCGECGNSTCDPGENPQSCKYDCLCGNGTCDPGETLEYCSEDCTCGDGVCSRGESCAEDCPCFEAAPRSEEICGDGVCAYGGCGLETCRSCAQDCGRCRWQPAPERSGLVIPAVNDVWVSPEGEVFAVTGTAVLHRHPTAGWRVMATPTTQELAAIWGASPSDVFAVGGGGTILHYDGGRWTPMTSDTEESLGAVWGLSATDVFVGGASGTILHYDGQHWSSTNPPGYSPIAGFWGSAPDNVFATGGDLLHFNGEAWYKVGDPLLSPPPMAIWGSAAWDVFAVGSQGRILHFDGVRWAPMTSPVHGSLTAVWGRSSRDVYAVGSTTDDLWSPDARSVVLHYDGQDWSEITSATGIYQGVWGDGLELVVVGRHADQVAPASGSGIVRLLHGQAWETITAGPTPSVAALWGVSATEVFAVTGNKMQPEVLRFDGQRWLPMELPLEPSEDPLDIPPTLWGIWGRSATEVYAWGGSPDTKGQPRTALVLRYDGQRWQQIDGPTFDPPQEVAAIWGSSPTALIAVGNQGAATHYDGAHWTQKSTPTTGLNALWGSGPDDLFAVGPGGTILRYDGESWSAMTSPTNATLTSIWGTAADDVFAGGAILPEPPAGPFDGQSVILHYDGRSWKVVHRIVQSFEPWLPEPPVPLPGGPVVIHGRSATDVFATTDAGLVHFDGTAWQVAPAALSCDEPLTGLWVAPTGEIFLSGVYSVRRLLPLN